MPYKLSGYKYAPTGGHETSITWSFGDTNIGSYARYSNYPAFDSPINIEWRALVRQAFQSWDDATGIKFIEVSDSANVDIRIGNDYIDGSGKISGNATCWTTGSTIETSAIRIDGDAYTSQVSFFPLLLHEIGHAIGLEHSEETNDVMYPDVTAELLTPDAVAGAVSLYGSDTDFANVTFGNDSNEYLTGTTESDTILGGLGADTIGAFDGNDLLFGGQGDFNDVIYGGSGSDFIFAGDGDDFAAGDRDDDVVGGGLGSDTLDGNDGNDVIYGGGGVYADFVTGGVGDDVAFTGQGDDVSYGGDGNDSLGGGAGADYFVGDVGDDVIYLGLNDGYRDVLLLQYANGNDVVYAFENGLDLIDVRGSGFTQFSQLNLSSAADGDAVITLASGQGVTLDGISARLIDASDFIV